jgi:UDP-2-acetamido-2-deoxy-ribo-hexuluronate aminotransferase
MQFIDLKAQYARIQDKVEADVLAVLRSGQFILGPKVEELEARLADYVGSKHCLSCASGTDALVIALMALDIGPGDAVFTTPFTFFATVETIALTGATPVMVDIDLATFNIDPAKLEAAIAGFADNPKYEGLTPKAIMPVDLFGLAADYAAIRPIAARHGITVIEDAAQSFGARLDNRRAGSLAEIGCTSFFPAKPLGCYGDGGAMFTDDDALMDKFRSIRVHGQGADRYEHARIGLTARLDAVQAAVLLAKMDIFDDEIDARQRVAKSYDAAIADAGLPLVTPVVPSGYLSAWAQYSVLADDEAARDAYRAKLGEAGVPTMVYYPKPMHLQTAMAYLGHGEGDFPVSEEASKRIFSLPMHPYLVDDEIARVVAAMKG